MADENTPERRRAQMANEKTILDPQASPLREADAESLRLLMSMDPLQMTDEDVDKICEIERKNRANWAKVDPGAGAGKGKPKKIAMDKAAPLSLDDLLG